MRNKKIWVTAPLCCVILGIAFVIAGCRMGGRPGFYIDRRGIHAAGDSTVSKLVCDTRTLEDFESMEIQVEYADVELVVSDRFAIDYCIRSEYGDPVCEVRNNRLIFREADTAKVYNIGFFTSGIGVMVNDPDYYVRVEIPKDTKLSKVLFNIESGDLDIFSLQAEELKIENEYGNVTLDGHEGKKLDIQMESGSLSVGTIEADHVKLKNAYGDVSISETEGDSLTAQIESGDFRIDQMNCTDAKITNAYGNIRLGLLGKFSEYGFDLKAEYGEIRIGREKQGSNYDDEMTYFRTGDGDKKVTISCESGNIEIDSVK